MKLLYAILMGIWRDGFGKSGWGLPIFKIRFVEHIVAFLMTAGICWWKDLAWYWCLWVALWIQIEWAIRHGAVYDVGALGKPDEKTLKRYETMVGYKLFCKIFPKDKHYSMCFDYILLTMRYTYPLLPIFWLFNPVFLFLGLIIASMYLIYRYCPVLQTKRWCDVELYVGFIVGLFVAFL